MSVKIQAGARLLAANLTAKSVEQAIKHHYGYDVKLKRDPSGYFYFYDPDNMPMRVTKWDTAAVWVNRLNQLSLSQWLAEFEALMKDNKDRE